MVTVVLPVSRSDYLQKVFMFLEDLECDPNHTNLFVYVDGDVPLYQKARNFTVNSKFNQKLCEFRRKGLPNVSHVRNRRKRISDIHNEIKEFVQDSEYLLLFEDDTLIPPNTLRKLMDSYALNHFAGFISGVEVGRWGYKHIGAWEVDNVYEPMEIISTKLGEGLQPVDAAGLYCCLMRTENYLSHIFKPFEDILGPDVDMGIELRRQGLLNYVDYSIKCVHLTKKEPVTFSNSNIIQVQLKRDDSAKFGWKTSVYETIEIKS